MYWPLFVVLSTEPPEGFAVMLQSALVVTLSVPSVLSHETVA
jgi:hypothetical protein